MSTIISEVSGLKYGFGQVGGDSILDALPC